MHPVEEKSNLLALKVKKITLHDKNNIILSMVDKNTHQMAHLLLRIFNTSMQGHMTVLTNDNEE